MKEIKKMAEKANGMVIREEKNDGTYSYAFDDKALISRNPIAMALLDAIGKLATDVDSKYQFMKAALENIADSSSEDIEELRDNVSEWADNDTDVYTSDLTEWLNRSDYNVYYLTEALDDGVASDGFNLLQIAQLKAREDVYNLVIDALESLMNGDY